MKPPICEFCGKDFRRSNEGGLVTFAATERSREFDEKSKTPGFVGHPPNVAWFCDEHFEAAKSMSQLTLSEAMQKMR